MIYMQYDDNSIGGDVTDANFTGWIELSSFQWGMGRPITPPSTGTEADRESSIPSVSEIVVTKAQDSASGGLMRAACRARRYRISPRRNADWGNERCSKQRPVPQSAFIRGLCGCRQEPGSERKKTDAALFCSSLYVNQGPQVLLGRRCCRLGAQGQK